MKILMVSKLIASALVHRLVAEGNEVKLCIVDEDRQACLEGFVTKVDDWKQELTWVGKDGLIIFDDVLFAGEQDRLREQGYRVVGGDSKSDRLELDRHYFQTVLSEAGIPVLPSHDFITADEAISYIKNHPDTWVVKQSGHFSMLNFVGQMPDGSDAIDVLKQYKARQISPIHIQRKVTGVEVGVARYFNGHDWIGPIEINFEHKNLCNGDIGPLTAEMGSLLQYTDDETLPLYQATLAKLTKFLRSIEYKGDFDLNCIINEKNIYPLEATPRFGMPAIDAQCELHKSPWAEFLQAVATGDKYTLDYHKEYAIVVSVMLPPFPYGPEPFGTSNIITSTGTNIFLHNITKEDMPHIHFEEISTTVDESGQRRYFHSGKHGYALYVTGRGKTVTTARTMVYDIIKRLNVPKGIYRTDIGEKYIRQDEALLHAWGWL